jgi:hypothetical protein
MNHAGQRKPILKGGDDGPTRNGITTLVQVKRLLFVRDSDVDCKGVWCPARGEDYTRAWIFVPYRHDHGCHFQEQWRRQVGGGHLATFPVFGYFVLMFSRYNIQQ